MKLYIMVKKRKKKIYNTPKKNKHKHVNNKLNIINSINNPRCSNCSNTMANHKDRLTCSHCNNSESKIDSVLHSAILFAF